MMHACKEFSQKLLGHTSEAIIKMYLDEAGKQSIYYFDYIKKWPH